MSDAVDKQYLTKADCRRLGLTRADVDRMFDRVPLVAPPGSRKVYVTRETLDNWIQEHTITAPAQRAA